MCGLQGPAASTACGSLWPPSSRVRVLAGVGVEEGAAGAAPE